MQLEVLLFTLFSVFESIQCINFTNLVANLDNVYSFSIGDEERHVFEYRLSPSEIGDPSRTAIKITTEAHTELNVNFEPQCPLVVSIRQRISVLAWDVPVFMGENRTTFNKVERSICIEAFKRSNVTLFLVEISTCSSYRIDYTVTATLRRDLMITLNEPITSSIRPTSPTFYKFNSFDPESSAVFIHITSTTSDCMIVSVQQPTCPAFDLESDVERSGYWFTVTTKAGMFIKRNDFLDGFIIVFVQLPSNARCKLPYASSQLANSSIEVSQSPIEKKIVFSIREDVKSDKYVWALISPSVAFFVFTLVIFLIHLAFHRMRCLLYLKKGTTMNNPELASTESDEGSLYKPKFDYGLHINDLLKGKAERLMEQSKRYYTAGLLVASFYCVPVFQLILTFHKRLQDTGNFDLCYFNYQCSHMYGMFHDFNHLYSNIGYLICGAVFIGIVYLRQERTVISTPSSTSRLQNGSLTRTVTYLDHSSSLSSWWPKAPWDIRKGVFVHYGLFYAMGFSLFMTGVMSGAYHICPNKNNFQFDTAFMYTIAALGIITIYQFRHPTYVSANLTFLTLAMVGASTVLGLLWESTTFRVFFTAFHLTALFVILLYIHYLGYVKEGGVVLTEWRKMAPILIKKWHYDIKHMRLFRIQNEIWYASTERGSCILPGPCRLIFPITALLVNAGALAMIWTVMQDANFASQVLAVYVINSSLYTIYYSIMKMIHRECRDQLWIQPLIYLGISLVLWASSLSYFGDLVTLWEKSPAESRTRNAECIFLGFYDSHDIWHFISAAALFSSLMVLLTIDDDLVDRPKSQIPVF